MEKQHAILNLVRGRKPEVSSPSTPKPETKVTYPGDAGILSLKVGDVIMTRCMYEFLLNTIKRMPTMAPEDLSSICNQLSTDMEKLVK